MTMSADGRPGQRSPGSQQAAEINVRVFMHITYLEEKGRLADAFALADRVGFGGIELRGFDRFKEMSDAEYLFSVQGIAAGYPNLKITFNYGADFASEDESVRKEWERRIAAGLRPARDKLGADLVNLATGFIKDPGRKGGPEAAGSNVAKPWQWDAVAAHVGNLGRVASSLGMRIVLETHHGLIHDTAAATKRLLDTIGLDSVGANFDYGNMIMHPDAEGLAEALEMLKDRIYYLHVKNTMKCGGSWMRTFLEHGHIDHDKYFSIISKWEHLENLALECPRPGDRVYACERDMAYLRHKAREFNIELS